MKKFLYTTLTLCLLTVFYSCDKEENSQLTTDEVRNTLKSMYPSANDISWEIKNGYIVADFQGSRRPESWGERCRTRRMVRPQRTLVHDRDRYTFLPPARCC